MKQRTRDQVVLPLLIPLGGLAVIGALAFVFSRMLLAVSAASATVVALVVGCMVLLVAGLLAKSRQAGAGLGVLLATFIGVSVFTGGALLAVLGPPVEHGEESEPEPAVKVALVAKNTLFEQTELQVPADEPFQIDFDNQDPGVQHNVEIFEGDVAEGETLYEGALIAGVNKVAYNVEPLKAGTYAFNCVVHPTMIGKIVAGGDAGGDAGGKGSTVDIVAKDLVFDPTDVTVAAGPLTINFDNQDPSVPHNIQVFAGEVAEGELIFDGELITGLAKTTYDVGVLEPGTFAFDCVVHPTMLGKIVVEGSSGADKTGGGSKDGEEPAIPPDSSAGAGESAAPAPPEEPSSSANEPQTLPLSADALTFSPGDLTATAGSPIAIAFDNKDSGIPHNVQVFPGPEPTEAPTFDGEIVTGPAKVDYDIGLLEPGVYAFNCKLHPTMLGKITVT